MSLQALLGKCCIIFFVNVCKAVGMAVSILHVKVCVGSIFTQLLTQSFPGKFKALQASSCCRGPMLLCKAMLAPQSAVCPRHRPHGLPSLPKMKAAPCHSEFGNLAFSFPP